MKSNIVCYMCREDATLDAEGRIEKHNRGYRDPDSEPILCSGSMHAPLVLAPHIEYIRSCGACPWFTCDPEGEYGCQHHEAPKGLRTKHFVTPPSGCPIRGGVALLVVGNTLES